MKLFTFFLCSISILFCSLKAQESYLVFDSVSGKVFYANETEKKRPIASLTKIATAKLVYDWAKLNTTSLNTLIEINAESAQIGSHNPLKLQAGDKISLRDALYATLLASDNISAHALASYVGNELKVKRNSAEAPLTVFVKEMNRLAGAAGMQKTNFVNPHGLDEVNNPAVSTATDIAKLTLFVLEEPGITFIVKQKKRELSVLRLSGEKEKINISNTNKLIGKKGVIGLKTGQTAAAGQCLISVATNKPIITDLENGGKSIRQRQLIIVLLGSKNRFEQTKYLIEEGWKSYESWGKDQQFMVPTSGKGLLKLKKE